MEERERCGNAHVVYKAYMWRLHTELTQIAALERKHMPRIEFILHTTLLLSEHEDGIMDTYALDMDHYFALLLAVVEDTVYRRHRRLASKGLVSKQSRTPLSQRQR